MIKSEIRKTMLSKRKEQSIEDKTIRNQDIIKKIRNHPKYKEAQVVAIFYPMGDEINLLDLLNDHKTFLFPRVKGSMMDFYVYHKDMVFIRSNFGVLEPAQTETIYQNEIDLMIVPALAIDQSLSRVGYGKGYYDKYISQHTISYTLGVIYDFQEVDDIEVTPMDQKLDAYIKGSL